MPKKKIIIDSDKNEPDLVADKMITKEATKNIELLKKVKTTLPMEKYAKWYYDMYIKQISCMTDLKNNVDLRQGPIIRMQNISMMKYTYQYNTMDMIVVVMKLYDYTTKQETNYGTLFCELINTVTPSQLQFLGDKSIYGNVVFAFYSAMPSYISCDGEYRSQFSAFKSLVKAKKIYGDIWNEIEEYVNRIRIRRQWSPYTSYFYPKMEQERSNTEVEYAVKNELIPLTLLTVSWFITIFDELIGMTKTHINQNYKSIFLQEKATDIEFLKELIKKYGEERIELFKTAITQTSENSQNKNLFLQCGYKMIPLNIKEVQDPLKLRYKPWREYFISNRCNDLVINAIAPNFAIMLDWFYIKNSRKGLYDNKSQYDRMKHSELAKNILQVLYEAQRGTYFATENLKSINKTSGEIKQWISNKFKKLNEKIDDPINYSIEEIIMSEVTLAFVNEYVGRTFADSIEMTQNSKPYNTLIGQPFKDSGYNYFAKYMFELCYGLFCINSKLGLIHGDFHLNNATIGPLYISDDKQHINRRVLYNINDQMFMFPNNGYFGCIIDFSRCIINPANYLDLTDASIPSSYTLVDNEERFINAEINNLITLYVQLFPNKLKQRDELVVLFKNYFDAAFRLLTCIDLYMFTIRLSRIMRQMKVSPSKKSLDLVDCINKMSNIYIATEMNYLINDPSEYSKKILADDFPILTIIKKCFSEFITTDISDKNITITDIYCYSNEIKHSLDRYETFPDMLKYVKYETDGHLHEVKEVSKQREQNRIEYEKQKLHNLEMVNYISLRHAQKLV